jgi:sec-independent protein translocase protein TatB
MFDIGWAELAVIGIVALIVVGPKDLPVVLRTGAHWIRQMRKLSREFQSGVDSIVRDADLDEAKKIVTSARQGTLKRQIETAIDPTGEMKRSLDPKDAIRESDAAAKKATAAKTPGSGTATPAIAAPANSEASGPLPAAAVDKDSTAAATPAPATPSATTVDETVTVETPPEPKRSTGS